MIQPILLFHNNVGGDNRNGMLSDSGNSTTLGSQGIFKCIWPTDGVFNNLIVTLDVAPGVGNSITCTVRKLSGTTALTVTISGTDVTGQLTGVDAAVTAGEIVDIIWNVTGTPAAGIDACVLLEFVPDSGNKSCHTTNIGTQQTGFVGPFMMLNNAALQNYQQQYVATPGNITALYAANTFGNVTGAGNELNFYINLNGVRQDGTGGTVDTKCSVTLVNVNVAVSKLFTLPVARGDVVYIESVEVGTYPSSWTTIAMEFTADDDGCSNLAGAGDSTIGSGATNYNTLNDADALNWTTTVDGIFGMRRYGGITPYSLENLYLGVETDPGAAPNSRTFTVRVNGSDSGLTGTITTGNLTIDNAASVTVEEGYILSMKHVPFDTPTVTGDMKWTVVVNTDSAPALTERCTFTLITG